MNSRQLVIGVVAVLAAFAAAFAVGVATKGGDTAEAGAGAKSIEPATAAIAATAPSSGQLPDLQSEPRRRPRDRDGGDDNDNGDDRTPNPTAEPTSQPTAQPTSQPTAQPTSQPTARPTAEPTIIGRED